VSASVLYDAPGPRALARNRLMGWVGTLALAAILGFVLYRFVVTGQFDPAEWDWITYKAIQLALLSALGATLAAFGVAAVTSLLGELLAANGAVAKATTLTTANAIQRKKSTMKCGIASSHLTSQSPRLSRGESSPVS